MGHEGAAEIEDVALDDADFAYHFAFRTVEDAFLYIVNMAHDVIQSRKTRFCQDTKHLIKQMRSGVNHIGAAFALGLLQCVKEGAELIDFVFVSGDEMRLGQQNIHFAGIGGAFLYVEQRDVNGEEEAVAVFCGACTVGRRDKLLDGKRMHVEMFANVLDIVFCGIFNINPRKPFVGDNLHGHNNFSMCFTVVYHFFRVRQYVCCGMLHT